MALKERLIQLTLKARDLFSGEVEKSASAVDELTAKSKELKEQLADTTRARGLARTLRDNEQAAQGLGRAMQDAQGNLADLTREIEQSENVTAGQSIAHREAKRAVDDASRAYDRNQRAIANVRSELKALGVNVEADMTEAEQKLTAKLDENKRALDENREAIKRKREAEKSAADAANDHASRVNAAREAMSGGMRTVIGYAAAYVSLEAAIGLASRATGAIRDGIVSMLRTGDEFEGMEARLTSLMGSIEAGEQATAWIKDFAKTTPLSLEEVINSFALLRSYGLDPMDGTLQRLVDKSEQLGGGMERLTGIVTALGQANAKGKLQTEEVLQLVERGVPVWDMLAKVTGKNAEQLQELATQGRLGRDVIAALIVEMGKSADGEAAKGMARLSGLMSNLTDTATGFLDRIADAGALDFVKGKLKGVSDTISEMESNGSLDRLAKALSNAFVVGASKAEDFVRSLLSMNSATDITFGEATDKSTSFFENFGAHVDDAALRIKMFIAPFRSLFNGIISSAAIAAGTMTKTWSMFLDGLSFGVDRAITSINTVKASFGSGMAGMIGTLESAAKKIPDMLGGAAIRAALADARKEVQAIGEGLSPDNMLFGLRDSLKIASDKLGEFAELSVDVVSDAGADIANAWSTTLDYRVEGERRAAAESKKAAGEVKNVWEQVAAAGIVSNDEMRAAIVQAASDGAAAITDMAGAMELIETAQTVQQFESLRSVMLNAYQDGKISLEQYQQATNALNGRIKEISAVAAGTADAVSDLSEKFESLADVQQAISSARTDVDINAIKKALRELYEAGTITAAQYNQELQNVTARQKELKGAVEQTASAGREAGEQLTKSQEMYNQALEDGIVTIEEARRASGQRMEDERRALGEAMEMRRRGNEDAKADMQAMNDWVGGVLSSAREPLAAMSAAALEAYDKLRGISSVSVDIDTSGLDATRASLRGVADQLDAVKAAQLEIVGEQSLSKWLLDTQRASLEVQQAYLGQKAALQSLMERYESGSMSLKSFVAAAKGAADGLNLLDDSDLSGLESAIASAEQQMKALGDSTRSTLDSLRDELDGLEGREADIERRKFAARQRDLQAQLAEAQASGDATAISNANRALGMLREIEAATAQRRQREEQQQRVEAAGKAPAAAAQPAPTKIIRLESRGKTVDIPVSSDREETNLLAIIEDAGLRSL